jgi:hypothetical protein
VVRRSLALPAVLALVMGLTVFIPGSSSGTAPRSSAGHIRLVDNPLPAYQGGGLEGADPVQAGCSRDAYTVDSSPITFDATYYQGVPRYGTVLGHIDLRYSPRCQTNWARAVLQSAAGIAVASSTWPAVARIEGGNNHTYYFWSWQPAAAAYSGVVYTDMVYSPTMWHPAGTEAPNCARAEFEIVIRSQYNHYDFDQFELHGYFGGNSSYAMGVTGCF